MPDISPDPRLADYAARCLIPQGKNQAVHIDPGTRVYRDSGGEATLATWFREVHEDFGGELVPYEWVAEYVGVSRPSVHKRVKRGGLTVLLYELQDTVRGALGGERTRTRREFSYVPRTECDAWRDILIARSLE
ncbi:hypothetical protein [Alienimonas chondri]|uniref:Helix-turn-helix domain-containing protein n=1 Tax=Alienimonas chondri TaxID=2681879 RepID=A0ABX1V999_9PLAN|nr:hypothetical protein [Alienimonas chondri]NNJ24095.1 hypothetical protein [Alienimonas chondri]